METKPEVSRSFTNMSWIWGVVLILLGGVALLGQVFNLPSFGGFFWASFFAGGGLIFLTFYLRDHTQWWAQIPAYVFFIIGILIAAASFDVDGKVVGVFVMWAIALPFFYVYSRNPNQHWWALIPAYVMTAVGMAVALSDWIDGKLMGAFITGAIALPFYVVYIRDRKHWWALIPAGLMSLIAVGLAASQFSFLIPVGLIAVGVYLLLRQRLPRHNQLPPSSGPEADKPQAV